MQKHYKLIAGLLVCVLGVSLEAMAPAQTTTRAAADDLRAAVINCAVPTQGIPTQLLSSKAHQDFLERILSARRRVVLHAVGNMCEQLKPISGFSSQPGGVPNPEVAAQTAASCQAAEVVGVGTAGSGVKPTSLALVIIENALKRAALFDEVECPNGPIDDENDVPQTAERLDGKHDIGDFVKVLISDPDCNTRSYLILQKTVDNKWALCTNVMLEYRGDRNKSSYFSFNTYHCNIGTIVIRHPDCSNLPGYLFRFEDYACQFEDLIQNPSLRYKSVVMQKEDGSIPSDKAYFVVILDGQPVLFEIPSVRIETRPKYFEASKILRVRADA